MTPDGQGFLTSRDLSILQSLLIARIYGADELRRVLSRGPLAVNEVHSELEAAGLTRITQTQSKRLVEWFRLAKLAIKDGQSLRLQYDDA